MDKQQALEYVIKLAKSNADNIDYYNGNQNTNIKLNEAISILKEGMKENGSKFYY